MKLAKKNDSIMHAVFLLLKWCLSEKKCVFDMIWKQIYNEKIISNKYKKMKHYNEKEWQLRNNIKNKYLRILTENHCQ